jgi:guanosine-3',5'-bis(diphosphate) 3'-pyrophosphohydrolase
MDSKNLSFAQVTDIYGFGSSCPHDRLLHRLGILHQLYKPLPGKFKDHIAIAKLNGYQSCTPRWSAHRVSMLSSRCAPRPCTWWPNPASRRIGCTRSSNPTTRHRIGWAPSGCSRLLDIQDETRDAAEFWDHVKVDLFPDAVYVFTPKSQIMAMPRGATVVDFAYAIHSNVGDRTIGSAHQRRTGATAHRAEKRRRGRGHYRPFSTPNPAWLGFVRTGRARSKIRHHLKTMAHTESEELGEKLLTQACAQKALIVSR